MRHHLFAIGGLLLAASLFAAPAQAAMAEAASGGKLYDGPGFDYPILATYKAHARFEIVWCKTREGWCLVQHDGKNGWLQIDVPVAQAGDGTTPAKGAAAPPPINRSAPGTGNFIRVPKSDPPASFVDKIAPAPTGGKRF